MSGAGLLPPCTFALMQLKIADAIGITHVVAKEQRRLWQLAHERQNLGLKSSVAKRS